MVVILTIQIFSAFSPTWAIAGISDVPIRDGFYSRIYVLGSSWFVFVLFDFKLLVLQEFANCFSLFIRALFHNI